MLLMPDWCFINNDFRPGAEALLPVQDLSIQRGYGVFDFLRVHEGIPLFAEAHVDRLFASAAQLRLPLAFTKEVVQQLITKLIELNKMHHSGIRITVTGGRSPDGFSIVAPNLIITEQAFAAPGIDKRKQGIKLVTHEHQRQMAGIKTIDYLMAIWLQPFIKEQGAEDVLYISNGLISECPRANFFLLAANNTLVTPRKGILEGITRRNIIACATEMDVLVEERDVHSSEIASACGAFICSTTKELLPVSSIDGKNLSTDIPLFTALQELLSKRIKSYKAADPTLAISGA